MPDLGVQVGEGQGLLQVGANGTAGVKRLLTQYAKAAGPISGQGTDKKQPMNVLSGTTN